MSQTTVQDLKNNGKTVIKFLTGNAFTIAGASGELKEIGKPSKFNSLADPGNRISNYIKSKMNIVDLIPCDFTIDLMKALSNDNSSGKSKGDFFDDLKPKITYLDSIKKYKELCNNYSIVPYAGVRIFTTDETIATDEFRNQYADNIISSFVNSLTQKFRSIRAFGKGATSKTNNMIDRGIKETKNSASEFIGEEAGNTFGSLLQKSADVLISGQTISMPKVWDSSSYSPNTSIVIKLVSPYGCPEAIHEFIIKPLTYLLLLTLPRTKDGMSSGYPPIVSVRAYGMTDISVGAIQSLTLRRGGNDTSFNIYKQPLSIDVSMQIENLVDGCAAYEKRDKMDIDEFESNAIPNSKRLIADTNVYQSVDTTLMQTPGKIIRSLSPTRINTLTSNSLGLNGDFINPADVSPFVELNQGVNRVADLATTVEENNLSGIVLTQTALLNTQRSASETSKVLDDVLASNPQKKEINDSIQHTSYTADQTVLRTIPSIVNNTGINVVV